MTIMCLLVASALGQTDYLRQIRDAQAANNEKLRSGKLEAHVTLRVPSKGGLEARAAIQWSGNSMYVVSTVGDPDNLFRSEKGVPIEKAKSQFIIYDPYYYAYNNESDILFVGDSPKNRLDSLAYAPTSKSFRRTIGCDAARRTSRQGGRGRKSSSSG